MKDYHLLSANIEGTDGFKDPWQNNDGVKSWQNIMISIAQNLWQE